MDAISVSTKRSEAPTDISSSSKRTRWKEYLDSDSDGNLQAVQDPVVTVAATPGPTESAVSACGLPATIACDLHAARTVQLKPRATTEVDVKQLNPRNCSYNVQTGFGLNQRGVTAESSKLSNVVRLQNSSAENITLRKGQRIAQIIFNAHLNDVVGPVDSSSD